MQKIQNSHKCTVVALFYPAFSESFFFFCFCSWFQFSSYVCVNHLVLGSWRKSHFLVEIRPCCIKSNSKLLRQSQCCDHVSMLLHYCVSCIILNCLLQKYFWSLCTFVFTGVVKGLLVLICCSIAPRCAALFIHLSVLKVHPVARGNNLHKIKL